MKHLDLFSGIGGFALAADRVFGEVEHTFVEHDLFCQAILRKHFPNSEIYGDIRSFATDTISKRTMVETSDSNTQGRNSSSKPEREMVRQKNREIDAEGVTAGDRPFLLTGGFPCQPFSQAGRRKGTADDRYLWPEMFRVIRATKPTWVIAENVRGLVTWNDGMVLETVCSDMEGEGYEVQPIIIPAVAVGAPHRRDRVWIVAHSTSERQRTRGCDREGGHVLHDEKRTPKEGEPERNGRERRTSETGEIHSIASHTDGDRRAGRNTEIDTAEGMEQTLGDAQGRFEPDWERDWREVALATCHDGVDDGITRRMGDVTISGARHRKEGLKACGNAIVPQVAMEIFKAIRKTL